MLPKLVYRQLIVFTIVVQLVLVVVVSEPQQQQSSSVLYNCNSKECVGKSERFKNILNTNVLVFDLKCLIADFY